MKILHISDTHNNHRDLGELPQADVLVHTGDFSNYGTEDEVLSALEWLMVLPYKHIIFVAGNHDGCLFDAENIEGLPGNVHFLHNSSVVVDGISFYGLAFTNPVLTDEASVDVLISHEPPLGVLDFADNQHWGAALILDIVTTHRPRLHLFGHIHHAYGIIEWKGTVFSNAAVTDQNNNIKYSPRLLTY